MSLAFHQSLESVLLVLKPSFTQPRLASNSVCIEADLELDILNLPASSGNRHMIPYPVCMVLGFMNACQKFSQLIYIPSHTGNFLMSSLSCDLPPESPLPYPLASIHFSVMNLEMQTS